jgi:hypothetical protein
MNNLLVFRLEYGRFRMLFTGDAGSEAEARILASGADLHADVLKVGHNGSAYSSTPEFIRDRADRRRHLRGLITCSATRQGRPSRLSRARARACFVQTKRKR